MRLYVPHDGYSWLTESAIMAELREDAGNYEIMMRFLTLHLCCHVPVLSNTLPCSGLRYRAVHKQIYAVSLHWHKNGWVHNSLLNLELSCLSHEIFYSRQESRLTQSMNYSKVQNWHEMKREGQSSVKSKSRHSGVTFSTVPKYDSPKPSKTRLKYKKCLCGS